MKTTDVYNIDIDGWEERWVSIFACLQHLIFDGPGERSRGRAKEGGISTGCQGTLGAT